ncbi:YbaB/EbfC family DNA-binding protein [Nonomuraea mesophila]|uniref:YbaB/EbfC family DNA-binding protein n=1 Tax=Nonomuraea mesophila TaxID=2530382 RepID=A0A4R5FTR7_9ACTN|nr:YbaB/EbfC family nucleoid-associated protein [Nonomuraea mesophila]TDE57177.1 YbaB/EbfC family DNA-binding protein [Nonomuraea mesophila]
MNEGRSFDPELDRLVAEFREDAEPLSDVIGQIDKIEGEAASAGGKVVVRVAPSGELLGVRIDPRAMRMGSEEMAEAIMDAARQAMMDAGRRAMQVAKPYLDLE